MCASSQRLPTPEGFATEIQLLDLPQAAFLPPGRWVLLGDEAVQAHWRALGMPEPEGSRWVRVDETTKRLDTLIPWLEAWAALPLHRDATLVGVGGGVLTDMVGLAAALFLRGLPWQAWPTTLLAQVDAGVGGKTAVNLGAGKNLAGAFHPPERMVVCASFLDSLPERQLLAGSWEVVKAALIQGDLEWAASLLTTPRPTAEDLARALLFKAEVVHRDPTEQQERRLLNLGHTLGHALEAASRFQLLHGEAVGLGLLAACHLAEAEGLGPFPAALLERLAARLAPLASRVAPWEACLPWLVRDKKAVGAQAGAIHCILPRPGGRALQRRLPPEAWASAHARMLASLLAPGSPT